MKHFHLLFLLFLCLNQALTAQDITFLMGTQTYQNPADGVSWVYHNGIGQYALANLKGERLTGFQFEAPASFKHEVAIVKMEDKYYFLTKKGEIKGKGEPFILPAKNGYYYPGYTSKGDKISQDSLELGILTPYTRVCFRKNASPAEYLPGSKYAVFKQAGKCGVIDSAGNVVLPAEYNEINLLKAPYVSILKNRKYGIASFDGTVLLAPEYDYFDYHDRLHKSSIVITHSKYKVGAYNLLNRRLIGAEYDDISAFYEGKAWAHRDHQYFLLESLGTELLIGPDSIYKSASDLFLKMETDTNIVFITLDRQPVPVNKRVLKNTSIDAIHNQLICISSNNLDSMNTFIAANGNIVKLPYSWYLYKSYNVLNDYSTIYDDNKNVGLIDRSGNVTIPPIYSDLKKIGPEIVAVKKDHKWGLLHPNGTLLKEIEFDAILYEKYGHYLVRQGKLWETVSVNNTWIPEEYPYDYVKPLQNGGLLLKQKERVYYSYDDDPEMREVQLFPQWVLQEHHSTPMNWDDIIEKSKPMPGLPYSQKYGTYNGFILVEKDGKYGFFDQKTQKVVIPLIYDEAGIFLNQKMDNLFVVKKSGKYGIINKKGEELVPFKYDKIHYIHNQLVVVTVNQKMGIIDTLGVERLPPAYDYIGLTVPLWYPNSSALVKSNNLYGLISNQSGRLLCPAVYDSINVGFINSPECILVSRNKLLGVINTKGQELIPPVYQEISAFNDGEYFKVRKNGFYGIVDRQHQILVPPVYHQLNEHIIYKDKKAGILGSDFKEIIAPQYEQITRISEKIFLIEDHNKKFYAHIDKGVLFQVLDIFDEIDPNQDKETGYFRVRKGNKWGYLNEKGEIVIPLNFIAISFFHDGIAHVLPPDAPPSVETRPYLSGTGGTDSDANLHIGVETPRNLTEPDKKLPYPIDYLINAQGEIIGVEY